MLEREHKEERNVNLRYRIDYIRKRISELPTSSNETQVNNKLSRDNYTGFGCLENSFAETENPETTARIQRIRVRVDPITFREQIKQMNISVRLTVECLHHS